MNYNEMFQDVRNRMISDIQKVFTHNTNDTISPISVMLHKEHHFICVDPTKECPGPTTIIGVDKNLNVLGKTNDGENKKFPLDKMFDYDLKNLHESFTKNHVYYQYI